MLKRPELLVPAGDSERLEAALDYGADAVYLGGKHLGMRAAPSNFSDEELPKAVRRCHEKNVKVYYTLNSLIRNAELSMVPSAISKARDAGVDAFIVSDLGVMKEIRRLAPDTDIHISTQAGVVNYAAAEALYELGAKRIITARELSLDELSELRAKTPKELEIECFVHGALCISFSGRCLLSEYMTGRDANRGDCAQPCRWKYSLVEETRPSEAFPVISGSEGSYILNSKDLCLAAHIGELAAAGIDSFKIEGRAKSAYYTATVTHAYRAAVDGYMKNPSASYKTEDWILDELCKISFRDYCTGFYFGAPDDSAIFAQGGYLRYWEPAAIVLSSADGCLIVSQRNKFYRGEELELMQPFEKPFTIRVKRLFDAEGNETDSAPNPKALMRIEYDCESEDGEDAAATGRSADKNADAAVKGEGAAETADGENSAKGRGRKIVKGAILRRGVSR